MPKYPGKSTLVHPSLSALPAPARLAALALLFAVGAGCTGDETARSPAKRPKPRAIAELDAGERCPPFSADYREDFKSCAVDTDCELARVQLSCSGGPRLYGVASDDRQEFERCAIGVDSGTCRKLQPTRAEDGRVSTRADDSGVHARCVEGRCVARVEERDCGAEGRVCNAGELCVAYQSTTGSLEYECLPNPCSAELDCECANVLCSGHTDQLRACAADMVTESDVFCKTERR